MTREAVIVEAVRTPVGRRGGALKDWHPVDLLAHTLSALLGRAGLAADLVDDVIAGCVTQVGEQAVNVARHAALAAGFPERVPGVTVDRQCGSSQQAVHFAAQGVVAGAYDVVIACGVESMTRVPMGSNFAHGPGAPFGPRLGERYGHAPFNQGVSAELVARRWGLTRAELDAFSLESHQRAAHAIRAGHFVREIVPVPLQRDDGETLLFSQDEGVRFDTSLEKLAALKPAFQEGGVITAGNASQISDGAAALLIVERARAERLGLRARARFKAMSVVGDDPRLMLTAPIPATRRALQRADLRLDDLDLIEINEAFASVVLAYGRELGADRAKVNVSGGAVALGHPLGASGARLMTTLLHELERVGGRYGLQTMCEAGGTANATILERLA